MPDGYQPLYEDDVAPAFESGDAQMKQHIAMNILKKAGKFGAASSFNTITHNVGGIIFEAPAAISTYQHIQALSTLQGAKPDCTCEKCGSQITYIVNQKNKKLKNVVASAVPVIGKFNSLKNAVHHFTKKNQGDERRLNAHIVWNSARSGCPKAKAIIAELLGGWENQKGKQAAEAVIVLDNGWKWVMEKMSAT